MGINLKVKRYLNFGGTNPFLKKGGGLVNPYINYQKALDGSNASEAAKAFISKTVGLCETKKSNVISEKSKKSEKNESGVSFFGGENENIVNSAKKYMGTPYVWGGESINEGGMDCSGFVYNALKDAGYNLGRTTAQGYRSYGTSVDKSDMQAGDLVFFGSKNNATHVGIYLGDGKMIHSSGGSKNTAQNPGKGVCVTSVDYRNDFLEARRY